MLYGLVCLLTGSGKGYVNTYRLLLAVACLRLRAVCLVPFLWLALTQRAGEPQDLGMAWICCWHGREVGGGVHFKGGWYVCMGVFVSLVGGYVWVSQSVGWVCVCVRVHLSNVSISGFVSSMPAMDTHADVAVSCSTRREISFQANKKENQKQNKHRSAF